MPGFDVNGIGGNAPAPSGPSGLLLGLNPTYQSQQLQNQATQLALKRATAFQDGVPRTADGSPDIDAMSDRLYQVGDYGSAEGLQKLGIDMQGMRFAQQAAGAFGGQGGGSGSGSAAAGGLLGGLQPAAGGGMIATGAGGDNFGRAPGNGYAGVGQVGAGGAGMPARPPGQGGQGGGSAPAGDYLSRLAQVESGGNDNAPTSGSSAFGRYRFTTGTWNGLASEYPQLGLTPDGRSDFGQQQRAIQAFTNDNASALGRAGIQPTPGNLYLAHFAGAGGAIGALKADPNTPVSAVLGDAAVKANPFLANMTAGALVGWANGKMAGVDPSTVPGSPGGMSPDVAASLVRLRAGQGTPQDGAAVSSYQASRAQGQGQGGAPTNGPVPLPPARPTDPQGAPSDLGAAPPSDGDFQTAQRILAAAQNVDLSTTTPEQRAAITRAAQIVQARQAGGGQAPDGSAPPSTDSTSPTSDVRPMMGRHPYAPATPPATPPQNAPGAPGGPAGGFQPASFGGPGGGAPGASQPPGPQGGPAPQPSVVPRAPAMGGATPTLALPPTVAAALARLQAKQGSPADAQLWGSWLKGQGQGQGGQAPVGGQATPPSSPYGAAPGGNPVMSALLNEPGVAGILRSYKGGQFANDPGGALMDMRRTEIALGASGPYGQNAAIGVKAAADHLDAAITRSATLTNEEKNARDPATLADLAKRQAIEQGARLAADTDSSRVTFAGDEAAARAAGAASYDLVPTQPNPGGPTVYRTKADVVAGNAAGGAPAVQGQPGYFADKQAALGKLDGDMQAQFQTRQVAEERLDAMSNLLETFQSGAGADAKAAAVAAVRAAGFDIPDSATASPAAVEQFSKNAIGNVFAQQQQLGGRVLVSELQGLQKANANANMQPGSNAAIIAQQKGLLNWEDQHYADYSAWRQANPYATDASSFEQSWAKAHPVSAYVAAARKDIAPLGAPAPAPGQWVDGQAYMVNGQKVRWDAASGKTVPFSGTTAPVLPGQGGGGQPAVGQGQGRAPQSAPPVAGARQARDGNWYVSDPNRPGKFLQVAN